jgi:hypothetical protein
MKTMFRTCLGLGLVVLLAGPAMAQGRGFGRGFGGGYGMLLTNASVQKELKLDDKQVEKAKEVADKAREEMQEKGQGLQDLEPQERRAKMMEIGREVNASTLKAAGEFLKPEQIARLKQISYQQQGLMAFNDLEVAKKLNLTDSQKGDIQEINREVMEGMRGLFSQDQSPEERQEAMKKVNAIRKEALTKAESKLNDEQQKTWKELLGAPFTIVFEPRPNN